MSNRNGVNIVYSKMCVGEGAMNNREDRFEMGTGGNFRDNATIIFKDINLRGDDIA